jgi:hypothetical protein
MRTRLLLSASVVGCLGLAIAAGQQGSASPAKTVGETPDDLRAVLEVFRSDFNTGKIRTINQVMKLTEAEAEKFWPIYREYETELAAVADRKIALIREFITLHHSGGMTNSNAAPFASKWLAVKQAQLDLWKKYHQLIGEGVSPVRAAQFLQVEHQIALMVDINIASEMPLAGQPATAAPASPATKPSKP